MFDFILWILAQIRHSAIVMSQHRDMGPISLFFFFSFYGCTCSIWKFPGPGVELEL